MSFSLQHLFDVSGLVVVVTGGATGIGLMIAQALSQNGARVYITGRREDVLNKTVETHGKDISGELIAIPGDTTSKESISALVKSVEEKESFIDICICNAGVGGPGFNKEAKTAEELSASLFETDYDEAVDLFKTNVLGYFYVAAAFIPLLSRSPNSPQVINVTSNAAFGRQAMAGILYSLSKAASTHLTKMLATHLSPISTIRCNAIAPGLFPSELTAGGSDDRNKSKLDGGLEGVPIPKTMGRAGTDAEMACSVLYLASKRQTYTNGSIVFIDGGVLTTMPSTY